MNDLLTDIIAHVTGSFVASPEYRSGFLTAVAIGIAVQVVAQAAQSLWKVFSDMFKPSKLPVTKNGPSPIGVVSKAVRHIVVLGMAAFFLRLFF